MKSAGQESVSKRAANGSRPRQVGVFYFCEKATGLARFSLRAEADGKFPVDEAAGLLAVQCLVCGRVPTDFTVLKAVDGKVFDRVLAQAKRILESGRAISLPVQLSAREKEVLGGVLENLLNKQIAARLNISERTVKFYVSSLLTKFRVRNRALLMQVAFRLLSREEVSPEALHWPKEAPPSETAGQSISFLPGGNGRVHKPSGRSLTA